MKTNDTRLFRPRPNISNYPQKRKPISKANKDTKTRINVKLMLSRFFHGIWIYMKIYLSYCGLHGLAFLVKKQLSLCERITWFFIWIMLVIFCCFIGLQSWHRFQFKSTVISVERDYHYWNTSVPALTLCPIKRLDAKLFEKYCDTHNIMDRKLRQELGDFLESLANSSYWNFKDIQNYTSTDSTLELLGIRPENYMELIYNLTINLIHMYGNISSEEGNNQIQIRQILTEFGICYMTNSMLSLKLSTDYILFGKYPAIKHASLVKGNFFNRGIQLSFLTFPDCDVMGYIHSGDEVARIDNNLGVFDKIDISASFVDIVTEDGVEKATTIEQRKCRFHHESNLTHFPIYTKNLCLQECRLNLAMEFCGCIPHFYPNRVTHPKPVCNYSTLITCFPKYKNQLMQLYRYSDKIKRTPIQCKCLRNCEGSIVTIESARVFIQIYTVIPSNGMKLVVNKWPTQRLKLQQVYSATDAFVSIGGTAGLLLGVNVLNLIELLYFFTLRLFFHLLGYKIS